MASSFFFIFCSDLSQGEVGGGVLGLNADGIFGAEVGALIVFVVHVKLCDVEVFVDAFIVSLDFLYLGEFAVNGGAFGRIRRITFGGWVNVGWWGEIVAAGTGAAAGVVAGEFGRRCGGERVLGCGI